ncbi:hypothetical protein J4714_13890 [Staphylococcus epidermidis]|nr:hypothetical protein [Staphylococcus epidermidis]
MLMAFYSGLFQPFGFTPATVWQNARQIIGAHADFNPAIFQWYVASVENVLSTASALCLSYFSPLIKVFATFLKACSAILKEIQIETTIKTRKTKR